MNKIISLIFHVLFFIWAIFSLTLITKIPERYLPILELLPFIIAAIAFILAYKFNRSLVIYSSSLFLLIYLYLVFSPLLYSPALNTQQQLLSLNSLTIFLALNTILLCFYSERGIFTSIGISRFIFILLQAAGIIWLIQSKQAQWLDLLTQTLFPALEVKLAFLWQTTILVLLVSIIVISSSYLTRANPFRSAIFVSMFLLIYAMTLNAKDLLSLSVLCSYALILPLLTLISESYRMAFMDDLTNLPGRRALNEDLNTLGSNYVIAMLDVDHFKKFNDTYGHDAGDDVLQLLGARLKGVKGGGKPFRYGGEEFTIVFSGASLGDVKEPLEDLREAVASKKFALRKQERRKKNKTPKKNTNQRHVSVTISIGYAERNNKATTPSAVLKASDKALYRAKKKGRNCVCK
ncbi:MAG: GGDEF domain-containing protein [Pseudomonadota bacterium]